MGRVPWEVRPRRHSALSKRASSRRSRRSASHSLIQYDSIVRYPQVGVTVGIMQPPPADVVLLPEALRRGGGYRTALIGKNHMVPYRRAHPDGHPRVGHGLDHFCGFYGGASGYWPSGRKGWQCNGQALEDEQGVYTTDLITREAVRVVAWHPTSPPTLSSRPDSFAPSELPATLPLFLWVSWTAPHRPLDADPEVLRTVPTTLPLRVRTYVAMVRSLDNGVGRVRDALASRAMLNRSLLVVLSDNGGPIQPESCNGGLRARLPLDMRVTCATL